MRTPCFPQARTADTLKHLLRAHSAMQSRLCRTPPLPYAALRQPLSLARVLHWSITPQRLTGLRGPPSCYTTHFVVPFLPQARTADTMKHVLRAHKRQLRGAALCLPWRPMYDELQRIMGGLGMKLEGERAAARP